MSRENPYADHLGELDPLTVVTATPWKIERLLKDLGMAFATRTPAPGKWSAREIVCNLGDAEITFAYRPRQIQEEDHLQIPSWDQKLWSQGYDSHEALMPFCTLRRWNAALVRTTPGNRQQKKAFHPEHGELTFRSIVETMGGHDLNHLLQLEKSAKNFASE